VQEQLSVCEKHAAEHEMFESGHLELMKWMEICRQQLVSSDVTKDPADRWVCMLSMVVIALVLYCIFILTASYARFFVRSSQKSFGD